MSIFQTNFEKSTKNRPRTSPNLFVQYAGKKTPTAMMHLLGRFFKPILQRTHNAIPAKKLPKQTTGPLHMHGLKGVP
jgi:hypothetical protein